MGPLPPIDHVARALVLNGSRDHAIALLEAHARRGGPDAARCAALVAAMRARPQDRPSGPVIPLDAQLTEELARSGLLLEARAVARGGRIAAKGGVEIAAALEQVLEAPPPTISAAHQRAWADAVGGSLDAAAALERDDALIDPWLRPRVALVARLLRGFSVHAPTAAGADEAAPIALPEPVRAALAERVAARDLPGALHVLRLAQGQGPTVGELVAPLARIVVATERLIEEGEMQARGASTVPLGGHGLALFQLRMGNLAEAERAFRRLVVEQANDHVARERLADVIVLRRALDPGSPAATSRTPSDAGPGASFVLDKKSAKVAAAHARWSSGTTARPAASKSGAEDWDEDATNVMPLEREAEMLLKTGRPERALLLLEQLREGDPGRAGLAERIADIRRMIEERGAPLPGESTVQRDVSRLRASEEARGPNGPATAPIEPAHDFDDPTLIGRRPAMGEPRADPLAQTQRKSVSASARLEPELPASDAMVVAVHRIVSVG